MESTKVMVLGASGMLGAMVTDYLARDSSLDVTATVRNAQWLERGRTAVPKVQWTAFDADKSSDIDPSQLFADCEYVVNAIGIIKPYIHDDNPQEVERALRINVFFPFWLARAAEECGFKVVQITTDCVYSGLRGDYRESDAHDALDAYGKSKSLGEVASERVSQLRCSIIGPETGAGVSLLEWFLGQPRNAAIQGFSNHRWNGVTTLHFARICQGIIANRLNLPGAQHVLSCDVVTKEDMVRCFAKAYGRDDINITGIVAPTRVDRTLSTDDPETNDLIWKSAGYDSPPTVSSMIEELSAFPFRLRNIRESLVS